jgi:hypothetical protein
LSQLEGIIVLSNDRLLIVFICLVPARGFPSLVFINLRVGKHNQNAKIQRQ